MISSTIPAMILFLVVFFGVGGALFILIVRKLSGADTKRVPPPVYTPPPTPVPPRPVTPPAPELQVAASQRPAPAVSRGGGSAGMVRATAKAALIAVPLIVVLFSLKDVRQMNMNRESRVLSDRISETHQFPQRHDENFHSRLSFPGFSSSVSVSSDDASVVISTGDSETVLTVDHPTENIGVDTSEAMETAREALTKSLELAEIAIEKKTGVQVHVTASDVIAIFDELADRAMETETIAEAEPAPVQIAMAQAATESSSATVSTPSRETPGLDATGSEPVATESANNVVEAIPESELVLPEWINALSAGNGRGSSVLITSQPVDNAERANSQLRDRVDDYVSKAFSDFIRNHPDYHRNVDRSSVWLSDSIRNQVIRQEYQACVLTDLGPVESVMFTSYAEVDVDRTVLNELYQTWRLNAAEHRLETLGLGFGGLAGFFLASAFGFRFSRRKGIVRRILVPLGSLGAAIVGLGCSIAGFGMIAGAFL